MSNRTANKQNTYSNLSAWCEKYHKDSGLKVHPSSVPVDLVLEDILGYIAHLRSNVSMLMNGIDVALKQIADLQEQVIQSSELHAETTKLLRKSLEVKETKKAKKNDKPTD